jgi:hypothetical protein
MNVPLASEDVIERFNLGLYELLDPIEVPLKIHVSLKTPQDSILQYFDAGYRPAKA